MEITDGLIKLKTVQLNRRFRGYARLHRSRYLLVLNHHLTDKEYFIYGFLFDVLADWDKRHPAYGSFEVNFDILGTLIKVHPSKLRRTIKALVDKGFIYNLGKNHYALAGFKLKDTHVQDTDEVTYYSELMKEVNKLKEENRN
ncbi:MAG: hypothetical protein RI947_1459 [Candidatus Parcubacteria bacterium]|jgi:hypothetical protein